VLRRTDVEPVIAEDAAHRVAERAATAAAFAQEYGRSFRLLAGMLHRPRKPIDDVEVDRFVARGQHLEDVPAHQ
jgi:hypothetical protein